ncbi:MAG TPA: hypothetical protein DD636_02780 [Anaerolineaceae bacterium]|nr:hypothetical protein [Anaerolineaceae bacterium]
MIRYYHSSHVSFQTRIIDLYKDFRVAKTHVTLFKIVIIPRLSETKKTAPRVFGAVLGITLN